MIHEHDNVVLTTDMPSSELLAGDVGTVIHVYDEGRAYEVEFISFEGDTETILTLEADKVRPVRAHEIPHVRELAVS